jgi:hypothetical protein
MEQNMRFGLILGQLSMLEKNWTNYEQLKSCLLSLFLAETDHNPPVWASYIKIPCLGLSLQAILTTYLGSLFDE